MIFSVRRDGQLDLLMTFFVLGVWLWLELVGLGLAVVRVRVNVSVNRVKVRMGTENSACHVYVRPGLKLTPSIQISLMLHFPRVVLRSTLMTATLHFALKRKACNRSPPSDSSHYLIMTEADAR